MNEIKWPLFEDLDQALFVATTPISPSYIQGYIAGLLCVNPQNVTWDEIQQKVGFENDFNSQAIQNLTFLTQQSLSHVDKPLVLILPEDSLPLAWRLESLSDWCGGFLEGVMLDYNENKLQQLPDILEILNDFSEIKNVAFNVTDSNQNEKDYEELLEFVRVSVLLFYTSYQEKESVTKDVVVH